MTSDRDHAPTDDAPLPATALVRWACDCGMGGGLDSRGFPMGDHRDGRDGCAIWGRVA